MEQHVDSWSNTLPAESTQLPDAARHKKGGTHTAHGANNTEIAAVAVFTRTLERLYTKERAPGNANVN